MKKNLFVVVIVIAAGFVGVYYLNSNTSDKDISIGDVNATTTVNSTTASNDSVGAIDGNNIDIGAIGDYTIEILPMEGFSYPSLERPIVIPDVFDAETGKIIRERMEASISVLQNDQQNLNQWLSLAMNRKIIHDYEGAKEIWEFVAIVTPSNAISFGNLGELYHLYLKDYVRSEVNYKKALELEPENISYYRGLFELYKYSYRQNTNTAADILIKGLEEIPEHVELLVLLGHYYRDKGDAGNAKIYYERAVISARVSGNESLASLIEKDLNKLSAN